MGPLEGPSGERAQFGVVSTLNISVDADTEAAQRLVPKVEEIQASLE